MCSQSKEDPNQRPMTQEEKDREERRNSKSYKDWLKYGNMSSKSAPGNANDCSGVKRSKSSSTHEHARPGATSSKHGDRHSNSSRGNHVSAKPSSNGRLNSTDSNGRLCRPDNNGASMSRPSGLSRQSEQQRLATERLLKAGAASSTANQSTSKSKLSAYQNPSAGQSNVSTWDRITSGMKKSSGKCIFSRGMYVRNYCNVSILLRLLLANRIPRNPIAIVFHNN